MLWLIFKQRQKGSWKWPSSFKNVVLAVCLSIILLLEGVEKNECNKRVIEVIFFEE